MFFVHLTVPEEGRNTYKTFYQDVISMVAQQMEQGEEAERATGKHEILSFQHQLSHKNNQDGLDWLTSWFVRFVMKCPLRDMLFHNTKRFDDSGSTAFPSVCHSKSQPAPSVTACLKRVKSILLPLLLSL